MPFKRNAEVGRVAVVNYGPETGKLVVISDIVDQNRALVDRPDEVRRVINFKRLALTDIKLDIPRLAKKKVLSEALSTADVFSSFEKSAWGQKLAKRQQKTQLTDFERFLAVKTRAKKAVTTRQTFAKLKKDAGLEEA
jgi:large subunit ribosomal protein L14e